MASEENIPANSVLFEDLCVILEQIYKIKKRQKHDRNRQKNIQKQELFKILECFFNTLKVKIADVQGEKVVLKKFITLCLVGMYLPNFSFRRA